MSNYVIMEDTLRRIADAVRNKTGNPSLLTPDEMADAIDTINIIDTRGDTVSPEVLLNGYTAHNEFGEQIVGTYIPDMAEVVDDMIARSSNTVSSTTATSVAAYAFYSHTALINAELPSVTSVGDYAFCNCSNLAYITTDADRIGVYAFSGCRSLSNIGFSEHIREIGANAFNGCRALTRMDLRLSSVSIISAGAFANSGINELQLPMENFCALDGAGAFAGSPLGTGGSGGTILIPQQFQEMYQEDDVWAEIFRNENNNIVVY